MNTNETKTGTAGIPAGANNQTPRKCSDGSPIPAHILAHAERHYPSGSRPKCPILASNWDRQKQNCIQSRLKIEADLIAKTNQVATNVTPPSSHRSNSSHISQSSPPQKSDPQKTSERSERTLDHQRPTSERDASGMRAASECAATPIRSQASEPAPDPSDPPLTPEMKKLQKTFVGYFLQGWAKRLFIEQGSPDWIGDVRARMDPRSPLDQLPLEKQQLLYESILEFGAPRVLDFVSLPEPEGWGIKTCEAGLKRFRKRYEKRTQIQKESELAQIINAAASPSATNEDIARVSERLLRMRLLGAVNNPESKSSEIRDFFQTLTRLRAQDTADKRLALAERKLNSTVGDDVRSL